jgi:hypothetical protein
MKKLITLLLATIVCLFSNAQSWQAIGGPNPFPNTFEHDFTILDNSRPVIVYAQDPSNMIQIQRWDGESWELLPQPTNQPVTEVEITHIGNTIVVGYYENFTEYFVMEYDGASWSQVGDIGVLTDLNADMKLIHGANPGDLWASYANINGNGTVKKWDGLSWTIHGADIVMSVANIVGGHIASDGNKVYWLSDNQISTDGWLHNANEAAGGFSQYGSSSVFTNQSFISMDCSPSKMPSIGYIDFSAQDVINFVRPDGLGDFAVDETFNAGPGVIANFDHAMGSDDSIFFVYTANSGEVIVQHQEGGTLFQYGSEVSTANPTQTDIEIFKNSDKPYVLIKEDVFSKIFTFNNPPVFSSDAGSNEICQDAANASYLTSITFIDSDFDSVYVSVVSNSPGLITSGNIAVTRINPYSSASNQNVFSIDVTPQAGQSGIANIDLMVSDGFETTIYPISVTVNALPPVDAPANFTVCDGEMITLNGIGALTYTWTLGVTNGTPFSQAIGTVEYNVTGQDGNTCQNVDSVEVTVSPNPPVFAVTPSNPSACGASNGSLTLVGLTSSTAYNISYNNGAVQGPFSISSGTGGALNISGLNAGSYSDITIENLSGCQTIDAGPYSLDDPSAPIINAGTDIIICEGEPVVLTAVNSGNALISWNNGILNGHTFHPSSTTSFTVTASSSGCTATDQVTVTVNPMPDIALSINPATCGMADGSVSSTITNGNAPYAIYWSNGTTGTSINALSANLYYINVTDANSCFAMEVATVSTSAITVTGTPFNNLCQGGTIGGIDLTTAGTGPFSYSWSNGSITEDLLNVVSGQYEVMITDGNECQASASFEINEPTSIFGELVSTNATCGVADGLISSTVLGGVPTYSYQWKDNLGADLTGETTANLTNYGTGVYSLVATDGNGCTHEFFSGISENNGPIVTVDSLVAASCAADGTLNVDVSSGFPIIAYNWSNGESSEDLVNINAGPYSITVEDANGCFGVLATELPALLPATIDICIVGVDTSTNTNLIVWEKPITDEIAYFNIYRESSVAGMFQLVDSVSYDQESVYNDTIAYPGLRSWRYRLGTVNACGNESILSDDHKTMHVTISSTGPVYNIAWDQYEGFSYPTYFVWRHTDADGWTQIDAVATTISTYTDTPASSDGIDYMVAIQPPSTCTATTAKATDYNSSRSNRSTTGTAGAPDDDSGISLNQLEVKVYPNPSEGIFLVDVDGVNSCELFVYDISGQLIFIKTINQPIYHLDLTHVNPGSYLLKVQWATGISNQPLIVR